MLRLPPRAQRKKKNEGEPVFDPRCEKEKGIQREKGEDDEIDWCQEKEVVVAQPVASIRGKGGGMERLEVAFIFVLFRGLCVLPVVL